ncbi:hypothetical protein [Brevibacterium sp. SMBL_HHYL_HB1]|nr:hypothetical protein [Brevibacterium sp. SMBL_HHYL_HB1]QUL79592.1 hypothetical protein IG171_01445 [Brevibacterium sp. SMBL_HHYL_HB1]
MTDAATMPESHGSEGARREKAEKGSHEYVARLEQQAWFISAQARAPH